MTLKQLAGDPKVRGNQLNTHSHHKSVARKLYVVLDGINKYTCENRLMDLEIGVKLDCENIHDVQNSAAEEILQLLSCFSRTF